MVSNVLDLILDKSKIKHTSTELVVDSIEESKSAKFYEEFYSEDYDKQSKPELLNSVKDAYRNEGSSYKIMDEIVGLLEKLIPTEGIVIEIGGSIHQNRSANAYNRFRNYMPLDISRSSILRYSKTYNKFGIIADAQDLPFKSETIDCIFTHTFLEHPLKPEKVLKEIVRVLKPGGYVVHNDAWFCRWWQRYGIVGLKPFPKMNLKEKLIFILAKLYELPLISKLPIILRRFFTITLARNKKNLNLRYKKLKPNYNLHIGCDEDAASRIDPVDVIRFYESRGFVLHKPLSLKQRILHPNKYIILQKSK